MSPYAKPSCEAVYRGVMSDVPIPCGRREHRGKEWMDRVHQADLPPAPGQDSTRSASWL